MYRSSEENGVRPLHYDCCSTINISDHRPVFGIFEATIKPVKERFVGNNNSFSIQAYYYRGCMSCMKDSAIGW